MKPHTFISAVAGCFLLLAGAAGAGEPAKDKKAEARSQDAGDAPVATIPDAASKPVLVTNTVSIGGRKVTYAVETGMLPLLKKNGEARASVFYIAYTRLDAGPTGERPVTFCFNGGPGSSSVWLHLGGLGPRRVVLHEDGTMPPPP